MIQLKVRRTNSIYGSWACEELGVFINGSPKLDDPLGIGKSIEDSIEDFISHFKILKGYTPNYKWR